jgi:hypothetical protein
LYVSRRHIACQHLGNLPQLADRHPERNYDEAADGRSGASADERISEAEFVDRNAKSNHQKPCNQGKCAYAEQQYRHTLRSPLDQHFCRNFPAKFFWQ